MFFLLDPIAGYFKGANFINFQEYARGVNMRNLEDEKLGQMLFFKIRLISFCV